MIRVAECLPEAGCVSTGPNSLDAMLKGRREMVWCVVDDSIRVLVWTDGCVS